MIYYLTQHIEIKLLQFIWDEYINGKPILVINIECEWLGYEMSVDEINEIIDELIDINY